MSTNFPTSLDTFPAAATLASENLDDSPHSTLHGNLGDAVAALEAKVGVNSSAVTTSLDYKVAALTAALSGYQPLDSDLTAIAALSTTTFGRALLALADAAALRSAAGLVLGTDIYSKSAVDSGFQPLDSDLTAIAALTTTSFGRGLLALADAAAGRTSLDVPSNSEAVLKSLFTTKGDLLVVTGSSAIARLPVGTDGYVLTADAASSGGVKWAAATGGSGTLDDLTDVTITSVANDDVVQRKAGAWVNRTIAQLLADLAAAGTTFQPLDSDLTAIAALSTTSFGRSVLAAANAAALATLAGVGTGDSPQFTAVNVGHATDTTITRTGAGDIAIEGNGVYRAGGTDVPVADGGTGASTAAGARTNLGIKAPTRQTFTSGSGTYTLPAGCTAIDVEVCAGGGGGGGADGGSGTAAAGSGGGSGGWLRKLIASPSATYSYAVGSGGAGGSAGPNSGAAGNDSTFGTSLLTAKGGSGGDGTMSTGTTADDAQGGAGGTVSTGGDFNSGGNPGDHGTRQSASRVLGGNGGSTPYGAGGRGGRSSAAGGNGIGYGAGGGGATATSTTDRAGGDGAGGIIIVTEYYG